MKCGILWVIWDILLRFPELVSILCVVYRNIIISILVLLNNKYKLFNWIREHLNVDFDLFENIKNITYSCHYITTMCSITTIVIE